MEKITRSEAMARAESVLRQGTRNGRKRLASQFAREVLSAIANDRCTDPRFCARLAIRTWLKVDR